MTIVGGMGLPELMIVLTTFLIPALVLVVAYFVIKHAVKRGVKEAVAELKNEGKL